MAKGSRRGSSCTPQTLSSSPLPTRAPTRGVRAGQKVKIITSDKELLALIPPEYVPTTSGGTSTHTFDPALYDALAPAPPAAGGDAAVPLS